MGQGSVRWEDNRLARHWVDHTAGQEAHQGFQDAQGAVRQLIGLCRVCQRVEGLPFVDALVLVWRQDKLDRPPKVGLGRVFHFYVTKDNKSPALRSTQS